MSKDSTIYFTLKNPMDHADELAKHIITLKTNEIERIILTNIRKEMTEELEIQLKKVFKALFGKTEADFCWNRFSREKRVFILCWFNFQIADQRLVLVKMTTPKEMKFFSGRSQMRSRAAASPSSVDLIEAEKLPSLATPSNLGKLPVSLTKSVSFADGLGKNPLGINLDAISAKSP